MEGYEAWEHSLETSQVRYGAPLLFYGQDLDARWYLVIKAMRAKQATSVGIPETQCFLCIADAGVLNSLLACSHESAPPSRKRGHCSTSLNTRM